MKQLVYFRRFNLLRQISITAQIRKKYSYRNGYLFTLYYLGKHTFADSAKIWMHLALLNTEGFKKIRKRPPDRNGNMHLLPATLANHSFFHGQNFTRKYRHLP